MRRFTILAVAFAASIGTLAATPASAQRMSAGYEFLKAIRDRDGTKVTEALQMPGSTIINTRDLSSGETALHIVVQRRDTAWVKYLLAKGINPNTADSHGTTALQIAASLGWTEGVEMLVKGGASVETTNTTGETPLILAIHRRDLAMAQALLKGGANPDKSDNSGRTARDYALEAGAKSELITALDKAREDRKARSAKSYGPGS